MKRKSWDADAKAYEEKLTIQTGIDGYRICAERTGLYDGQDEPEEEYNDKGQLVSVKVKVYRKDIARPFVGKAFYDEYVQRKKDGSPTRMWLEKPFTMLAKCAEALAMRRAFPNDLGGSNTDDEMPGVDETQEAPKEKKAPKLLEGYEQKEDTSLLESLYKRTIRLGITKPQWKEFCSRVWQVDSTKLLTADQLKYWQQLLEVAKSPQDILGLMPMTAEEAAAPQDDDDVIDAEYHEDPPAQTAPPTTTEKPNGSQAAGRVRRGI
jgi:hypothetical protein